MVWMEAVLLLECQEERGVHKKGNTESGRGTLKEEEETRALGDTDITLKTISRERGLPERDAKPSET